MGRPRVGHVPLETSFNEARGEGLIVSIQDQVDGSESAGRLALIVLGARWDDSDPEGIGGGGGRSHCGRQKLGCSCRILNPRRD